MTEAEVRMKLIDPHIRQAGWSMEQINCEYYYTAGRIVVQGSQCARQKGKKVDYLLSTSDNHPIAIIEAKDDTHTSSAGIQQAMDYAQDLHVKFAYSTNGSEFVEHDFYTGKETHIPMDQFPSPEDLSRRAQEGEGFSDEQLTLVEQPYFWGQESFEPRYYQRIAINKTIESIAKGQNRLLLVMATGTGKTYTAFQIIWRLHQAGKMKKILFLADRNVLIDQTRTQDFKPFGNIMTKIEDRNIDTSYEIYLGLYQQLVSYEEGVPNSYESVTPDFFDFIIIDECHRGSAKDDSEWRKVLEYFSSATQLGMTATPRADYEVDTKGYFGEPIYTYSLKQGIADGFLAPYRVTNDFINIDLEGWTPRPAETDLYGKLIESKRYHQHEFGRNLKIKLRREVVARRITDMLHQIGRMSKTIVFCTDIPEANAMRELLTNMNADLCRKDPRYVMQITGDDKEGKRQLDNFISVHSQYPTIVTTSQLLSTGVDCKMCKLVVIDKEIGSMTEFKQIVGRGTRVREKEHKMYFDILDFRNATSKFKDPEFDGDPIPPEPKDYTFDDGEEGPKVKDDNGNGFTANRHKQEVYTIAGRDIRIQSEIVSYLDSDGKLIQDKLVNFTRKTIQGRYATLNDFMRHWNEADRKKVIVEELREDAVLIDAVREQNPAFKDADIFDIICHVAYDRPVKSRRERAAKVKNGYLRKYQGQAREIIEILLEKYADNGILDFENKDTLRLDPLSRFGTPTRIAKILGGTKAYDNIIREIETELYSA